MPLIKDTDIETVRKYVKMNFTATAVKSMPDIWDAERKFLIPILTQPVFDALQLQVNTSAITWVNLLAYCRAAVAPLAVWLDLPFIQTNIGDKGLTSEDNAAHQWEYNKVEAALVNKGMAALEDLFDHLIATAATYNWTNAEAKENFIRTGKEFSRFVYLHQPNLTFLQLKPLMLEVEDHFIKASIGDETFEELRDKADPGKEEKIAIQLIKKSIAQYTVVRAVERMPVKITPNGLMASLQSNSEAVNKEEPAKGSELDKLMRSAQREGDGYHVQLMEHLNKYASATLFKKFYESEYYTPPTTIRSEGNDSRNICAL